jgi:hypothetical protein
VLHEVGLDISEQDVKTLERYLPVLPVALLLSHARYRCAPALPSSSDSHSATAIVVVGLASISCNR